MSHSPSLPEPESEPRAWVVCLCADWCGTCRDYRQLFAQAAARHAAFRFAWLDVEDQSALVGDIDVETFPTLLLADGEGVRFFGPVPPQPQTLSRLLDSLERSSLQIMPSTSAARHLLDAVRTAPEHWVHRL